MKIRFLIFSVCLIVLHIFFVLIYVHVLTKNSIQRTKDSLFRNQQSKSRIWILGDSHSMFGIDPSLIEGSFNFASTSENYFLNFIKLKNLLDEGYNPEAIILPIELHSFSKHGQTLLLQHEMDDAFWAKQIGWEQLNQENLGAEYTRWWISATFFPYAGQFYRFTSIWKKNEYELNPSGFPTVKVDFSKLSQNEQKEQSRNRFSSHFKSQGAVDEFQIKYLQKIKALCASRKISVLMIQFPVTESYFGFCQEVEQLSKVEEIINSETESQNLLNLRHTFENNPEMFFDPDHLNQSGAQIISKMVAEKLKEIKRKPVLIP
jgi:hypothetical protein